MLQRSQTRGGGSSRMCGEARSAMKLLADHLPGLSHFGSLFVTDFQEPSACISETVEKRTPHRFQMATLGSSSAGGVWE
jgi:hypothetical protein